MRHFIALLTAIVITLSGCSASLVKDDLALYKSLGLVFVLHDKVVFTHQGPFPIQIKQTTEDASNWRLVDHLKESSKKLLRNNFEVVDLSYESESLISLFNEHGDWPNLTDSQKHELQNIIQGKSVDAIVVIKEGTIPLGEIRGAIFGFGLYQRDLFLVPKSVRTHTILSGRIFDTSDLKPIAYTGYAISAFQDYENFPWNLGFSGMSKQAKDEIKTGIEKNSEEAFRNLAVKLGLLVQK